MKRCAVAVSVVAALAFVSVAAASATLTGKYATTITKPAAIKGPGHWTSRRTAPWRSCSMDSRPSRTGRLRVLRLRLPVANPAPPSGR